MAPTPSPTPPAPSSATTTSAAPAHLFGDKTINLVAGRDGRPRIVISRQPPSVSDERSRREGRGLRARGQRYRACGKSKGEFQKVAAFHDISSSRQSAVMRGEFDRGEMNSG